MDFLVYVKVYEPFNSTMQRYGKRYKNNLPILRVKSVISILGSQYLTELCEKITCVSDLSIAAEASENPDKKIEDMAKVSIVLSLSVIYFFLNPTLIVVCEIQFHFFVSYHRMSTSQDSFL